MKRRIGILASHPIQYHAPLFRRLALYQDLEIRVYFCHSPGPQQQGLGFGIPFEWDLELTSGYAHEWLRNCSPKPSLTSFRGCDTPDLPGLIRREQFDAFIVHGWNNLSCWQAFWGCRQTGTPLLVRGDSQLGAQQSPFRRKLKDLCYPTFISRFDVCIATGSRSAEYFEHFGAKRIIISPHIVDNSWFSERAAKAREDRKAVRSKWGLAEDAFVFLFAGKFEPKKRPVDLIHSFARIERLGSQKPALLMVGTGFCGGIARLWQGASTCRCGLPVFLIKARCQGLCRRGLPGALLRRPGNLGACRRTKPWHVVYRQLCQTSAGALPI